MIVCEVFCCGGLAWRGAVGWWWQQVARMAAVGFGLPTDTFADKVRGGPHLLAPTGSDFSRFNKLGTVLAGFHYGATSSGG